jgi:hypothetical protein
MLGAKLGITSNTSIPFPQENLFAWYDANVGVATGDGSAVLTTWYDRSGNGRKMNVNSAPVVSDGLLNGYPGVAFDGTDDFTFTDDGVSIISDYGSELSGSAQWTCFLVFRGDGTGPRYKSITGFQDATNGRFGGLQFEGSNVGTTLRLWSGTTGSVQDSSTAEQGCPVKYSINIGTTLNNAFALITAVASGSREFDNMMLRDGTSVFNGTLDSWYGVASSATSNILIGVTSKTQTTYELSGTVAECIYYDAAVPSGSRVEIQNYLLNKYGL